MPLSVLAIWVVSGLLALLGAAGVVGALLLSANRLGASAPTHREERNDGSCPCCGYSTAGLEVDRCPECGNAFAASARVRERYRPKQAAA